MDFELRQLRCAVALAEHKHFGRAARAVHLSQPALSRNILELEVSLGKRLFQRAADGTRLTDEGEIFLEQARKLLAAADQMIEEVKLIRGQSRPMEEVRVGIGMYPSDLILARATARFLHQRHDVRLKLTTDVYTNIVGPLHKGELEFAVIEVTGLENDRALKFRKLAVHQGYILVRNGHPLLSGSRKANMTEVQKFPWVMPPHVTSTRFRKLLAVAKSEAKGARPVPEVYVNSVPVMKKIVEHSDGWAFVTLPNVAEELRRGTLRVLPAPTNFYATNFAITWLAERPISPAADEFMEILVETDTAVAAEGKALEALVSRSH